MGKDEKKKENEELVDKAVEQLVDLFLQQIIEKRDIKSKKKKTK